MNKIFSSKLILPFSVAAVALVLVVGGILLLRQISESQPTPSPSPSPTPSSIPVVEVPADWKTYRNEEFGFEVRYPKNAEAVNPSLVDEDNNIKIILPSEQHVILNKYFTLWIRSNDFEQCLRDYSFYLEVGKKVTIADQEFFEEHSPEILADGVIVDDKNYFWIGKDFCLYLTMGFEYRSQERIWEDEGKVFDLILSAFRFTE